MLLSQYEFLYSSLVIKLHCTIDAKCPITHAMRGQRFGLVAWIVIASFNSSGFRAIKTGVCWYLQSVNRLRPLRLQYDTIRDTILQCNTIQYNTKFVKRHVAVASEALANRTVKKHRRTNVL